MAGSRKEFFLKIFVKKYVSRGNFMREIDSAYPQSMKTLPWPWFREFRFNTPISSLNQDQGSVLILRECAESISRIKLPLGMYFLQKFSYQEDDVFILKNRVFHGLGSGNHFHASGMRVIDFSHKITPIKVIYCLNLRKKHFFRECPDLQAL